MKLDRRQVLVAGSAYLASCHVAPRRAAEDSPTRLDELLAAHAGCLPERAGAGANHYPMAAEALEALGRADAIDDAWIEGAGLYAGSLGRAGAIEGREGLDAALGAYDRYGDWLDLFRVLLEQEPWGPVVGRWAPLLAPGICAATFHGVIRTGHAARALRARDTAPRRDELAAGLAYWAARYTELPSLPAVPGQRRGLRATLAAVEHPWLDDEADVPFDFVVDRLRERPLAPAAQVKARTTSAREELDELVEEAATLFLEMLVAERHRLWLLHTVTGPAAVEWLLPEVDEAGARALVEHARQAVVALFAAYGEPYVPRAHLRDAPPEWPVLVQRAVDFRYVHGIKLVDALLRFDRGDDPLWRSVAAQWQEWV